ncbi:MAG: DUF1286 domain-containing protein [Desulfurococcaceae archaeon]|nr:DUF1286 domain-containing protein [Desulfurococcaceae archaeon]
MKLLTHVLMTFALGSLIAVVISRSVLVVGSVFVISFLVNYLIDLLGHSGGRRTPLTHELFSNLITSLITGLLIHSLLNLPGPLTIALTTSLIASSTHLLLDSLSGGVFIYSPNGLSRLRLSSRRYDDYLLNTLVITASVVLLTIILYNLL